MRALELHTKGVLITQPLEPLDGGQLKLMFGASPCHLKHRLYKLFGLRYAEFAGEEFGKESVTNLSKVLRLLLVLQNLVV